MVWLLRVAVSAVTAALLYSLLSCTSDGDGAEPSNAPLLSEPTVLPDDWEERISAAVESMASRESLEAASGGCSEDDAASASGEFDPQTQIEVLRAVDGCLQLTLEPLDGRRLEDAQKELYEDETVIAADRPVLYSIDASNDPRYSNQWHLDYLKVEDLWDTWPEGASVTVAVTDTGVDGAHRDLVGIVVGGWDPDSKSGGGLADPDGHGTHVAGIHRGRGRQQLGCGWCRTRQEG